MFRFTIKETGEEIILPTPDNKQANIDPLPMDYDPKENKKYLKYITKRNHRLHQCKRNFRTSLHKAGDNWLKQLGRYINGNKG